MRGPVANVLLFLLVIGGCDDAPKRGGSHGGVQAAAAEAPDRSAPATTKPEPEAPVARASPAPARGVSDAESSAQRWARDTLILDGHVDVPWRLWSSRDEAGKLTEDVSVATEHGDFDYPRARKGGLDAPFMSIYVPAEYENNGAKAMADKLIDLVEGVAKGAPEKFALAHSPSQVRAAFKAGKVALPMGMENGSPLEGKLENVAYFHTRGIRYITLAHSKDNHISDSSYDDRHTHQGLSAFGKQVVAEMNRVGIMIDVSHISDQAFEQVLQLSKVPVIASHSSCRHFTPGWARNMSDDMIKKLAAKGGVIQINFGSGFVDDAIRREQDEHWEALRKQLKAKGLKSGDREAKPIIEAYRKQHPSRFSTVDKVADHVMHVIELVGVDHVGFGSDFDGVGDSLPEGLKDVSFYPSLLAVLMRRGLKPDGLEKIMSGNVLRVWETVDNYARQGDDPPG